MTRLGLEGLLEHHRALGLEGLLEHYRGLGLEVSLLAEDSPERIETGPLRRDVGYIRVEGRNFDLVALRYGGASTTTRSSNVLGIPVSARTRQKFPIEYHHIVRRDPSARPRAYKAKLKKRTRGVFRRSLVDVAWRGESLAAALNADAALKRTLVGCLGPKDSLRSDPDTRNRCVRIVFTRTFKVRAGFGILTGIGFEVTGFLPEAALLEAIHGIAERVRLS